MARESICCRVRRNILPFCSCIEYTGSSPGATGVVQGVGIE